MNENIKRLGDAELEIMTVVWRANKPVTANFILEKLHQRTWKLSTLMTSLSRLCDKGFLKCDRTYRNNLYFWKISESDYKARETKTFLEKICDNSFKNLIAALYNGNSIGNEDIGELRKFLDGLERRDDE